MKRMTYYAFLLILIIGALGLLFIALANWYVVSNAESRIYADVDRIPSGLQAQGYHVGLVLGCRPGTRYFHHRIEAATNLYQSGKVKHLLLSGDNHRHGYDEPTEMKEALMRRGVAGKDITCDFAGFRTLDSLIRASKIFRVERLVVVSQEFHNYRAITIADAYGVKAVALSAKMPVGRTYFWVHFRELLARPWMLLDLYLLQKGPKYLGKEEPIILSQA